MRRVIHTLIIPKTKPRWLWRAQTWRKASYLTIGMSSATQRIWSPGSKTPNRLVSICRIRGLSTRVRTPRTSWLGDPCQNLMMLMGKMAMINKKRARKTSNHCHWLDATQRLNTIRKTWSLRKMAHPQSWEKVREARARAHYMVSDSYLL